MKRIVYALGLLQKERPFKLSLSLSITFLTIAMDPDCGAWSKGREGGGGDGAGPEDGGGSRLRQVQCDSVGLNGVSKVTKTRGAPYLQTITGNIPCS